MKNKKLIQLAASAVMTLVFVNVYLKNKERTIESGFGMVEVVVAARDIPPHTLLSPTMVSTRQIPLKFVEPGAIMVKIPGQEVSRIQNKITVSAVPEGGQVIQSNLNDPSANGTGVAPLLAPGKRGYLLRLGNLDVAALILPGDHIDVMATFTVRDDKGANQRSTYTILQDILVLGVGRELRKPKEDVTGKKEGAEGLVLTLAVDPTEAERLALAQIESQGEITVTVRPNGENNIRQLPGVSPNHLLG